MNNPPFHIGQKVVFVVDSILPQFKKGMIFTVVGINRFCSCDKWVVDVGIFNNTGYSHCALCGEKRRSETIWTNSKYFAPIQTNYADATAEILEKFPQVSETPDKILKPEPINQC